MPLDRTPSSQAPAEDVANLEGFGELSEKQQQMFRTSLEEKNVQADDTDCHLAVFYLEQGAKSPGGPTRGAELHEFHTAGYGVSTNPTLEALQAQIEKTGFPCVVVPRQEQGPNQAAEPTHTFVAFRNTEGEIIGWEKRGFSGEYNTRPLADIYESSTTEGRDVFWGTRRLTTKKET